MARESFVTLDGSTITELIRPGTEGSRNLSVAQAVVAPGGSTLPHLHRRTEEVYYVLEGEGVLRRGAHSARIGPGAALLIPPGVEHSLTCVGSEALRILCLCAPPYEDEDTVLTGEVIA